MLARLFSQPKRRDKSPTSEGGEGVVRLSTPTLIGLRHAATTLRLAPGPIRAGRSGGYLSRFKGRGMEFDEVRPYQQGDDVRSLDWRVTARTGRPHTKLYREERERPLLLAVDLRHTMYFATRGAYKAVRAVEAAALFGWSGVERGDRIGALIFRDSEHREFRPASGRAPLLHLLNRLGEPALWQRPGGTSTTAEESFNETLKRLRRVASPGSLIFLLSDFAGFDGEAHGHLAQLARHNQLLLGFCFDPLEAELPPAGRYRVSDGSQTVSFDSGVATRRAAYRERFAAHRAALESLAGRPGIRLIPFSTAEAPLDVLQHQLRGWR
jgi:uncharacterized protein (DUF58 family)